MLFLNQYYKTMQIYKNNKPVITIICLYKVFIKKQILYIAGNQQIII